MLERPAPKTARSGLWEAIHALRGTTEMPDAG
jgi:hypothetical protein